LMKRRRKKRRKKNNLKCCMPGLALKAYSFLLEID